VRKLGEGNGPEPGEQASWKARGGFILNEAGVITAISADITPVVRQSPQHSIISVPWGLSTMQKMDFPADRERVDPHCRDSDRGFTPESSLNVDNSSLVIIVSSSLAPRFFSCESKPMHDIISVTFGCTCHRDHRYDSRQIRARGSSREKKVPFRCRLPRQSL